MIKTLVGVDGDQVFVEVPGNREERRRLRQTEHHLASRDCGESDCPVCRGQREKDSGMAR